VGRDETRLAAIAGHCRAGGATVELGLFDVKEAEPLGAWLRERDAETPFDIVVPAAGISAGTAADGTPEGLANAAGQVRTNLIGAMNVVEALLPAMIARGAGQVVLISSTAALRGLAYSPGYSASKAGVRAYGEGLRALLAPRGIAVTVVVPGFFDTPMTDRWHGPTPFLVSLDRMVAAIRHGVDRRRARVTFPRLLALGQQAADLLPPFVGDRIMRGFRFHIDPAS
jgi:short-subunit dehydrogenase